MLVAKRAILFPTVQRSFVEIKLVRKDDKDVICTDVVGVDKTHSMDSFSWKYWERKRLGNCPRAGERKQRICFDICSLSRLHTWQSTGIFPRIFQKGMNGRATSDSQYASFETEGNILEEGSMLDLVDYVAYPAPYYGLCDEYCSLS